MSDRPAEFGLARMYIIFSPVFAFCAALSLTGQLVELYQFTSLMTTILKNWNAFEEEFWSTLLRPLIDYLSKFQIVLPRMVYEALTLFSAFLASFVIQSLTKKTPPTIRHIFRKVVPSDFVSNVIALTIVTAALFAYFILQGETFNQGDIDSALNIFAQIILWSIALVLMAYYVVYVFLRWLAEKFLHRSIPHFFPELALLTCIVLVLYAVTRSGKSGHEIGPALGLFEVGVVLLTFFIVYLGLRRTGLMLLQVATLVLVIFSVDGIMQAFSAASSQVSSI